MILVQISAGQGPEECCLAVAKAFEALQKEAARHHCQLQVLEAVEARRPSTYKSLLLSLEAQAGYDDTQWIEAWQGSLQWICESPYRLRYPRKNWFVGVRLFHHPVSELDDSIRYEACRASGPGGQHVNKTDSAIRATHVASGISVKVQTERSQHANKKLAACLIWHKLRELVEQEQLQQRSERRLAHHVLERGAAQLVFKGPAFKRTNIS